MAPVRASGFTIANETAGSTGAIMIAERRLMAYSEAMAPEGSTQVVGLFAT